MGLDISLITDPDDLLDDSEDFDLYFYKHSLSRAFCRLLYRRYVIKSGEHEIDQIGRITGVDILPLYEMNNFPDEGQMEFLLRPANSEEERKALLTRAEVDRTKLEGNMDKIYDLINALIDKLSTINDLPLRITPLDISKLGHDVYFSDFDLDKGDGYIGNNFGQDLRNFRNYLTHAKSKGKTTVYFRYG